MGTDRARSGYERLLDIKPLERAEVEGLHREQLVLP